MHKFGEEHWNAKLTEADVKKIFQLASEGARQSELARKYGVTRYTIYKILHRKSWRHIE